MAKKKSGRAMAQPGPPLESPLLNAFSDDKETSHMTSIIIGVPFLLHVQSFCKASVLLLCTRARLTVRATTPIILFYFNKQSKIFNL